MKARYFLPVLMFGAVTSAEAADSFAGEWTAHIGESGKPLVCGFTLKGKNLSGNCTLQDGGGPVSGAAAGSVIGKTVKWTLVLQADGMSQTAEYSGQWDLKNTAVMKAAVTGLSVNGKPADMAMPPARAVTFTRTK